MFILIYNFKLNYFKILKINDFEPFAYQNLVNPTSPQLKPWLVPSHKLPPP